LSLPSGAPPLLTVESTGNVMICKAFFTLP
jgi:hypothetical protein